MRGVHHMVRAWRKFCPDPDPDCTFAGRVILAIPLTIAVAYALAEIATQCTH